MFNVFRTFQHIDHVSIDQVFRLPGKMKKHHQKQYYQKSEILSEIRDE